MELFSDLPDLFKLSYDEVKAVCEKCTRCPLAKGRNKVVFGSGPVPCDLMLIGEAPGAEEDSQGLPFVGRAGQLLTKVLESVGINRETDIYIANTVKCRPPENRVPATVETETCNPFLRAQIHLIKPKIILLSGAPAVKVMLKTEEPISKIRGKWFKIPGTDISTMPIFHPSYLLRSPSKEKGKPKWLTWEDMKEVRNALNFIKEVNDLEKESLPEK